MNLYELNQSGYQSLPKMTDAEIEKKREDIWRFLLANKGSYYMLVCNELKYYTLFSNYRPGMVVIKNPMIDTILEIVEDLGVLKAIEVNESMIEFWVSKDDECHMYAFFNYDRGVVKLWTMQL